MPDDKKAADPKKTLPTVEPPRERTAQEMRTHLDETGCPVATLDLCDHYIAEHPKASGTDLYDYLVSLQLNHLTGTIRRCCKLLKGPTAEPEQVQSQAATEQVDQHRQEAANLRFQLEKANADKRLHQNQIDHWKRKAKELAVELASVRHEQGLPPDKNNLMDTTNL